MILYHFSNKDLEVLKPSIGENRHRGEDDAAVGKTVIYLTTDENTKIHCGTKFRYTVEIDSSNPNLKPDRNYNSLRRDMNMLEFVEPISLVKDGSEIVASVPELKHEKYENDVKENHDKWYFYQAEIIPIKKEKWNGERYIFEA